MFAQKPPVSNGRGYRTPRTPPGASTAVAAGANVYWDVADTEAKEDSESGANKLIGKTIAAAADDDATVRVWLNQ